MLQRRVLTLPGGRRLAALEWAGRGPAVVLLHGMLDSAAGWQSFAATLGRRCLALDLPGFGRSDLPVRGRLYAYADDVAAALRVAGASRPRASPAPTCRSAGGSTRTPTTWRPRCARPGSSTSSSSATPWVA